MTPESIAERSLRSRLAAHSRWATEPDRTAATAKARQAFRDRFLTLADPDGVLDPEERKRRADSLRSAFYAKLALSSAQARRRRKG